MIRIDRHIPIPPLSERYRVRHIRMPYWTMKAGDSVFVPGDEAFRKMLESSRQHMRRHGGSFVVMPVFEDGEHGARCWCETPTPKRT